MSGQQIASLLGGTGSDVFVVVGREILSTGQVNLGGGASVDDVYGLSMQCTGGREAILLGCIRHQDSFTVVTPRREAGNPIPVMIEMGPLFGHIIKSLRASREEPIPVTCFVMN